MTKTIALTNEQRALAVDIMTNGFETGIAYWVARAAGIERDEDLNYLKYILKPIDYDDEGTLFEVTPEKIWVALTSLALGAVPVGRDLRKTFKLQWAEENYMDTADPDALSDDAVIQVACFGEIVYG